MSNRTVLLAAKALVGEELTLKENAAVIIDGGDIKDIVPAGSLDLQNIEAEIIDLGSRTLMPGMFECHNHLAMDARLKGHLYMMELGECEHTVMALKNMKDDLMSGVTTARCMGDRNYIDVKLKKMVASGQVEGPDLIVSGIGMRSIHGHGFVGVAHCGAEEFRRTARENMLRGVDLLKIFVTPGTPVPSKDNFVPCYMTLDEIKTVVEEAKSVNIRTAAHCIGGKGLDYCIDAGIDVIEHAYSITPEQIKRVENEYGGTIDMTTGIVLDESREEFTPPEQNVKMRKAREYSRSCMNLVYQSHKIPFTAGTDAYHSFLYREAGYAVDGGATTLEALKAVTVNAAKMCGLSARKGSIAPGLQADIIAVEENPLERIGALKDVAFVMKNGKVYKCLPE